MKFLYIQLLGVLAWLLDISSYWFKTKKILLILQILADLFFTYHYYLLGAKVGFVICLISSVRELCFYLINSKKGCMLLFKVLLYIYIVIGFNTSNSIIDLLPVLAEITYSYTLMSSSNDIVFGGIIDSIYWIIYGMVCHSYAGVITDIIVVVSNSLILFRRRTIILEYKKNYSFE